MTLSKPPNSTPKMGSAGLLDGYGFQNEKSIKKRISDKTEPRPKKPIEPLNQ
jgi:hypothetical protein